MQSLSSTNEDTSWEAGSLQAMHITEVSTLSRQHPNNRLLDILALFFYQVMIVASLSRFVF